MHNLDRIRREYTLKELNEDSLLLNPFEQFALWLDDAIKAIETDATAMVLSTVSGDGKPSSRVILLKQFNNNGFDFFTNYNSKKSKHIEANPYGSILFYWSLLERQVRIEGKIVKTKPEESDAYFLKRPELSRISAWASPQSSEIPNRKTLIDWFEEIADIMKMKELKRPPHWGGYRLIPSLFEFWQGRENRLHDRIEYYLEGDAWKTRRLAP